MDNCQTIEVEGIRRRCKDRTRMEFKKHGCSRLKYDCALGRDVDRVEFGRGNYSISFMEICGAGSSDDLSSGIWRICLILCFGFALQIWEFCSSFCLNLTIHRESTLSLKSGGLGFSNIFINCTDNLTCSTDVPSAIWLVDEHLSQVSSDDEHSHRKVRDSSVS